MSESADPAILCPVTRLPMSVSEQFALAVDVLGQATHPDIVPLSERRVVDCVMRNRAHIAEALAFFERRDAIRAAIAGLQSPSYTSMADYNQAIEDALRAFDREVGA